VDVAANLTPQPRYTNVTNMGGRAYPAYFRYRNETFAFGYVINSTHGYYDMWSWNDVDLLHRLVRLWSGYLGGLFLLLITIVSF
jgi:hypothetical protein